MKAAAPNLDILGAWNPFLSSKTQVQMPDGEFGAGEVAPAISSVLPIWHDRVECQVDTYQVPTYLGRYLPVEEKSKGHQEPFL